MILCASLLGGALLAACGGGNGSGGIATFGNVDGNRLDGDSGVLVPAGQIGSGDGAGSSTYASGDLSMLVPVTTAGGTATAVAANGENFTRVADENQAFSVASPRSVRYGIPGKWVSRVVAGQATCSNAFFGNDPAYGKVKRCEASNRAVDASAVAIATPSPTPATAAAPATPAAPAVPTLSAPMGNFPAVDVAKIVSVFQGVSTFNVKATSELPEDRDGAFRTSCKISHMSFDDPIVFPGQTGRSHLHTFFGNTGVNAGSTPTSIRTTGNSTCFGGTANRSAYWVPTMIDTKDGTPLVADSIGVYYKRGLIGDGPIQPVPVGLRMIAGDPARATPDIYAQSARFKCIGPDQNDSYGPSIPNCKVGSDVWQEIFFPQCWDGVNLDSPDHQSHMSYPAHQDGVGFFCPRTHPVAIPLITFNVIYPVREKDAPLRWRLSSDSYDRSLPGGYSSHGDWFNGWDDSVSKAWGRACVDARKDCHSHLLGDGRMVF